MTKCSGGEKRTKFRWDHVSVLKNDEFACVRYACAG